MISIASFFICLNVYSQLKELDLMSMTPLDAMNKLYELQQQAKQEDNL